jgi:hypothetical protein
VEVSDRIPLIVFPFLRNESTWTLKRQHGSPYKQEEGVRTRGAWDKAKPSGIRHGGTALGIEGGEAFWSDLEHGLLFYLSRYPLMTFLNLFKL